MKIARLAAIIGLVAGGAFGLSAASASAAPFAAGAAPFAAAMDLTEQAQYGPPPGYRRRGPPPRRYGPPPRRYQPRVVCETRWQRVRTPWGWERRPVRVCFRR
jgi:hypothetical protein